MSDTVVYGKTIHYEKRIKSTFNKSRTYIIKLGDVSWKKNGDFTPAVYVLVEYNGIEQKTINPHFLIEPDENGLSDLTRILEAMSEIKQKFKIK